MQIEAVKLAEEHGLHLFGIKRGWKPDSDFALTLMRARAQTATADAGEIVECWDEHPDFNIAAATGARFNTLVLEFDAINGGIEALEAIAAVIGDGPTPPIAMVGRRRIQVFFRYNGSAGKFSRHTFMCEGLTIRGEGDFVMIPPSEVGVDGLRSFWRACVTVEPSGTVTHHSPEIIPLPTGLIELFNGREEVRTAFQAELESARRRKARQFIQRVGISLRQRGLDDHALIKPCENLNYVMGNRLSHTELARVAFEDSDRVNAGWK
ncbi:bifunctional DNA primase/polymerase [Mesorhizobium sp. LHD-90]|uniref:bifunctional DNA primase/polymerase n=1 Tax=Mesorhizobium sp. LHD-90 TaxID=3071414 RepID=UPI0027E1DADE|nr:bifunctional DNA primase/polymerase [Mesorhizobium sp. LHD-90]MDQ6438340.1 bifunctional DNA primase/polymerase [Mesorhizobium sp. LHD-90]